MERPFEGCWRRIKRAETHRNAILRAYRSIQKSLYRLRVQIDSNGTGGLWLEPIRSIPISISVKFGEALYQLRAALNQAVYVAAIIDSKKDPPPDESSLDFPLFWSRSKKFKNHFSRKIGPLCNKRKAIIMTVQPCFASSKPSSHPNRILGLLDRLAEMDRHRQLHIVSVWGYKIQPRIIPPNGTMITDQTVLFPDGASLKNECKIVEFRFSKRVRSVEIDAQCDVELQIAIDEGTRQPILLGSTLDSMIAEVSNIVRSFEAIG